MAHILVVEDDPNVFELLRVCIELEEHEVSHAMDGEQALALLKQHDFDLIVLDIMLPNIDGFELCRIIREDFHFQQPIIMVTARSAENDKVAGLDIGADDYITKPFSPREFQARLRARLRSAAAESDNRQARPQLLEFAGLTIDPASYSVHVFGEPVTLTRKEFELLHFLAAHEGQTLTRNQILEHVWGYDAEIHTRTVDEHIRRIRQKLTESGAAYSYVQTIWGVGYKFEVGAP